MNIMWKALEEQATKGPQHTTKEEFFKTIGLAAKKAFEEQLKKKEGK